MEGKYGIDTELFVKAISESLEEYDRMGQRGGERALLGIFYDLYPERDRERELFSRLIRNGIFQDFRSADPSDRYEQNRLIYVSKKRLVEKEFMPEDLVELLLGILLRSLHWEGELFESAPAGSQTSQAPAPSAPKTPEVPAPASASAAPKAPVRTADQTVPTASLPSASKDDRSTLEKLVQPPDPALLRSMAGKDRINHEWEFGPRTSEEEVRSLINRIRDFAEKKVPEEFSKAFHYGEDPREATQPGFRPTALQPDVQAREWNKLEHSVKIFTRINRDSAYSHEIAARFLKEDPVHDVYLAIKRYLDSWILGTSSLMPRFDWERCKALELCLAYRRSCSEVSYRGESLWDYIRRIVRKYFGYPQIGDKPPDEIKKSHDASALRIVLYTVRLENNLHLAANAWTPDEELLKCKDKDIEAYRKINAELLLASIHALYRHSHPAKDALETHQKLGEITLKTAGLDHVPDGIKADYCKMMGDATWFIARECPNWGIHFKGDEFAVYRLAVNGKKRAAIGQNECKAYAELMGLYRDLVEMYCNPNVTEEDRNLTWIKEADAWKTPDKRHSVTPGDLEKAVYFLKDAIAFFTPIHGLMIFEEFVEDCRSKLDTLSREGTS
ncbi:MAG: hypothetical protein K6F35_01325 [Lachnospiraceae bacterium]|nr:hypothetical protein [Lachnospiraceae bacterium]